MSIGRVRSVRTACLDIGFESAGGRDDPAVVLLHGFPYDVRSFDEVAVLLSRSGFRVIAPYLRGFGPTRFLSDDTLRSGQQAALGRDVIDLLDGLDIDKAVIAGFDWGGRAACVAAALFPKRVSGLVTVGGYNIQDITRSGKPLSPAREKELWYQFYFHSARGRRGLEKNREALCSKLWLDWSPDWTGAATAFKYSAPSLQNPDFVDVVVHSYRHRFGLVAGDPAYGELEDRLADTPDITVPTMVLHPSAGGLMRGPSRRSSHFTGPYWHMHLRGIGHNPPQEAPSLFAAAVEKVAAG